MFLVPSFLGLVRETLPVRKRQRGNVKNDPLGSQCEPCFLVRTWKFWFILNDMNAAYANAYKRKDRNTLSLQTSAISLYHR